MTANSTAQGKSARPKQSCMALALVIAGLTTAGSAAAADAGYVGVLGGGPIYKQNPKNVSALEKVRVQ